MVRVYYGPDAIDIPLADIAATTADGVLKIAGHDGSYLTLAGSRLAGETPMSSLALCEDSCLRVVVPLKAPEKPAFDANKLKECKQMFRRIHDPQGAPHLAREAELLMDTFVDYGRVRQLLKDHPTLETDHAALAFLHDYQLLETYMRKPTEESDELFKRHPEVLNALHAFLVENHRRPAHHGMMDLGGLLPNFLPRVMPAPVPAPQGAGGAPGSILTPEYIQAAIAQAMGGARPQQPAANPFASFAQQALASVAAPVAPAPQQEEQQNRFGDQLQQLAEFGFTDVARNISILESVNGNIDQALELLIALNESEQ